MYKFLTPAQANTRRNSQERLVWGGGGGWPSILGYMNNAFVLRDDPPTYLPTIVPTLAKGPQHVSEIYHGRVERETLNCRGYATPLIIHWRLSGQNNPRRKRDTTLNRLRGLYGWLGDFLASKWKIMRRRIPRIGRLTNHLLTLEITVALPPIRPFEERPWLNTFFNSLFLYFILFFFTRNVSVYVMVNVRIRVNVNIRRKYVHKLRGFVCEVI